MSQKLVQLLLEDKIINDQLSQSAFAEIKANRSGLNYLFQQKVISETKLLYYLSKKFNLATINLDKFEISTDIIKMLTPTMVEKFQAIPIQTNQKTLVVAMCDPTYLALVEDLRFKTKMNVEVVLTSVSAFTNAKSKYYSGTAAVGEALDLFKKETDRNKKKKDVKGESEDDIQLAEIHEIDFGVNSAEDAPVISMVNGILREGIMRGASDIHVEPFEFKFRIRLRIDGTLHEVATIPMELKRAVVARLKIMSRMDIAESRLPQDGKIKLKVQGNPVDLRVNTVPTSFGEKVVLRILNQSQVNLDLEKMGFDENQLKLFRKGISAANGLVLVTGPTGSGKTTTLYSALAELNVITDNISTVEDPVEYNLDGINQIQVHKDIGLTFANILRALLRQDPDTILLGEIRDYETAEVAVQAALTGHLVLSTLHTNDAPSAITRMINMGIEPFLIVAAVNTIVAQRLLRRICTLCKTDDPQPPERLVQLGFPKEYVDKFIPKKGVGCNSCGKSGFKGRVSIYEILDFNSNLKDIVLKGCTTAELKRAAVENGMSTLRGSAFVKVAQGLTTIEEALSMTMEG